MRVSFKVMSPAALIGVLCNSAYGQTEVYARSEPWSVKEVSSIIKSNKCTFIRSNIDQAVGERRSALVIGNGSYHKSVGYLNSPLNDAENIAAVLLNLGFDVYVSIESYLETIENCANRMTKDPQARLNDTTIFYYSGHGIQINDENYIIPVNIDPSVFDADIIDTNLLSRLSSIIDQIRASSKNTFIFLDACRTLSPSNRESKGLSISTTEAPVLNGETTEQRGHRDEFVIMYATQPGNVTVTEPEFNDKNLSRFTRALIDELPKPNKSIQESLVNVTLNVGLNTDWRQHPFTRTTLSKMYFLNHVYDPTAEIERAKAGIVDAFNFLDQGKRRDSLRILLESISFKFMDWPEESINLVQDALSKIFLSSFVRLNFSKLADDDPIRSEFLFEHNFLRSPDGTRGINTFLGTQSV